MSAIQCEEEERAQTVGDYHYIALTIAFDLRYAVFVNFEGFNQGKFFLLQTHKTHDTVRKTNHQHSPIVLLRKRQPFDAGSLAIGLKPPIVKLSSITIVPESNRSIKSSSDQAVIKWRDGKIIEFSRIEGVDEFPLV